MCEFIFFITDFSRTDVRMTTLASGLGEPTFIAYSASFIVSAGSRSWVLLVRSDLFVDAEHLDQLAQNWGV